MQAGKLQRDIDETRRTLAATGAMLKGSVSKVILGKRKGGPGNRIAHLLTYKSDKNVTKSVYVPKALVATVKTMIRNYHKAKRALGQLVELNVILFKTTRALKRANMT